jgi:AcrR family transcriptional regulator
MPAPDALPEPPWWTPRKAGGARRSLDRELIVETALRVLRAEGIDAVSMRRVATELGTGAASLYAHVAHKEELLDLVFDVVAGEIPLPEPDPARWRAQITRLWTDSHEALARNGDIARVALGRVPIGPNSLRVAETTMAILRGAGIPDRAVAWAVDVVGLYIAAHAIEGAIHTDRQRAGQSPAEYYGRIGAFLAAVPPERLPTISALAGEMGTGDGRERFAFGLDLIIDGLAALVPDPRSSPT